MRALLSARGAQPPAPPSPAPAPAAAQPAAAVPPAVPAPPTLRGADGQARLLGGGALHPPPQCPSYAVFATRLLSALGLGVGAAVAPPPPPPADCAICLSAPPVMALLPCGHLCLCGECAAQVMARSLRRCPLCRAVAQSANRIFQ